jgi:tetratricopeptide (TPR) repeat protein
VQIFISYASEYRDLAQKLALALEAEGHESFLDRARLQAGQPFHGELREAIDGCDLFVFLVAPESVASGSYARSELILAEDRWRHPARRVLPVLVAPTPFESIPPYLQAVTVLQPQGDPVAETLAAVAKMRSRPRRRLVAAVLAVLVAAVGAGVLWQQQRAEQARHALRARVAQETGSANALCASGAFAAAWPRFEELASRYAGNASVLDARADCAMQWLREIRVQTGKQTFTDIVGQVQPAIVGQLAGARGARAGDLRAHLGWADYLRRRDGAGDADPPAHYQRALADDPANAYAHAMWGHSLMLADKQKEAVEHFAAALASNRDRAFVRRLQLAAGLSHAGLVRHAVQAADDMRRSGETMAPATRRSLWSMAYYGNLFNADREHRARFLSWLPAADHLSTFDWLYPEASSVGGEPNIWRFCRAMLLAHHGEVLAAREILASVRKELEARNSDGFLLDETKRQLAALR